jgi:hypothetical protein
MTRRSRRAVLLLAALGLLLSGWLIYGGDPRRSQRPVKYQPRDAG